MGREPPADAHRRLGQAERDVEQRMAEQADDVGELEVMRARARQLPAAAGRPRAEDDRRDDPRRRRVTPARVPGRAQPSRW